MTASFDKCLLTADKGSLPDQHFVLMKRRGPPPPFAPPPPGYGYGAPSRDWDGYRPYPRRGDYPPPPRPYKRGRSMPPPRPIRTDFFEFRLEKIVIGDYIAGK